MAKQNCENCRFFEKYNHSNPESYAGYCLRYPPQREETLGNWIFPTVHESDQCGEWRPILVNGNISAYHEE